MRQRQIPWLVVVLFLALLVTGCREADGPVPAPNAEQVNRTEDLARDLKNVSANNPTAVQELRDDLEHLAEPEPPEDRVGALVDAMSAAIRNRPLDDATTQRLSELLFVAVSAREFSGAQVDKLEADIEAALRKGGVAEGPADTVGTRTREVVEAIKVKRKRWWAF
jgi:hypothetical protein